MYQKVHIDHGPTTVNPPLKSHEISIFHGEFHHFALKFPLFFVRPQAELRENAAQAAPQRERQDGLENPQGA